MLKAGQGAVQRGNKLTTRDTKEDQYLYLILQAINNLPKATISFSGTGVTEIIAGTGLTGGVVTTVGTISLDLTRANTWSGLATFTSGISLDTITSRSHTYTVNLPTAQATTGQSLVALDNSGNLGWTTIANGITIGEAVGGYTPNGILYTNGPGNLSQGNISYIPGSGGPDQFLFGTVTLIAASGANSYTFPNKTGIFALTSDLGGVTVGSTVTSGTNNEVFYQSSGNIAQSTNLQFNGTTLTVANDTLVNGLTVGQGNTSGNQNTILGNAAGSSITTANSITAIGYQSLKAVTTAGVLGSPGSNTAVGYQTGLLITTGAQNTIIGNNAMSNTAVNVTQSVAIGYNSLLNASGTHNTGIGWGSLAANSFSGSDNVCIGYAAGNGITSGNGNVILGYGVNQLTSGSFNLILSSPNSDGIHVGGNGITTGSSNTYIGAYAGTNTSNAVVISDGDGNVMFSNNVLTVAYGTTTTILANDGKYDIEIGISGSGVSTVLLPTGTNSAIGTIYTIGDIGATASTNNITIDAGSSNRIVSSTSSQTYIMSINGQCISLKKITSTLWKLQ